MKGILILMTKREVFQLLKLISHFYDSFIITQEKVDEWYQILKKYSFDKLENNVRNYVTSSSYAPRISDLIQKPESGYRAIPNAEETLQFLYQKEKSASEEVIQQSLAKIRAVLGIQRGANE